MQIELVFYTEDSVLVEICKAYWELDINSLKAVHSSKGIIQKYNLTAKLAPTIKGCSAAYITDYRYCRHCEKEMLFLDRGILTRAIFNKSNICIHCREINELGSNVSNSIKKQIRWVSKPVSDTVLAKMIQTYYSMPIEKLRSITYHYLLEFCICGDFKQSAFNIGVSQRIAIDLKMELATHFFICSDTGFILPELRDALSGLKRKLKTTSIISPKLGMQVYYEYLLDKYRYVSVKTSLSAFISKHHITSMIKGEDEFNRFQKLNVDFLITDRFGNPIYALDYKNSANEDIDFTSNIELKEKYINSANISYQLFDSYELRRLSMVRK